MFLHNWEKTPVIGKNAMIQKYHIKILIQSSFYSVVPFRLGQGVFKKPMKYLSFSVIITSVERKTINYWVVIIKSVFIHILICSRNVIRIVFH